MPVISLNNFLKMSPEAPQYSEKNPSYLMSGVHPTYYLDTNGTQEEQIASLVASNTWRDFGFNSPVAFSDITVSENGTYGAYMIDFNSEVWGVNLTTITRASVGLPSGFAETTTLQKISCFAGQLLAVTKDSSSPRIYKMPLPSGPWTFFGSLTSTFGDEHFLEPFLEFCMVSDNLSQVRKIDSTFLISIGIDLGVGYKIVGMKNYNDKYLAIAATKGGGNFNENYLFLWNGRDDRYNYSMKIPGMFLDMKVIENILYVGVWVNGAGNNSGVGRTSLYYLAGTKLDPLMTPQVSVINNVSGVKGALFSFMNKVGMNLFSKDLLIHGKTEVGTTEFILSNNGVFFNKFTETFDGFLFATSTFPTNSGFLFNLASTTYNPILYKSQWIPVKNLAGIDIVYNSPPQSSTDAINVTIFGRGEDIISGSSTTVLDPITPIVFLNTTRTRLDIKGFTGDKVMIQLSTVNTGTWRPIIREINLITD